MTNNTLLYLSIRKYFIYFILWTPFLITTTLTIESLYFLYGRFNEKIFIPDRYVLEILFFTLMIPIIHWHRSKWPKINPIHKRIFLIVMTIGAIDLTMYALVFGFLIIDYLKIN